MKLNLNRKHIRENLGCVYSTMVLHALAHAINQGDCQWITLHADELKVFINGTTVVKEAL
jgi:hypothetical protein